MKVTFTIDYRTKWGEKVAVCGNIPALGYGNPAKARFMEIDGDSNWHLTVDVDNHIDDLSYEYLIMADDHSILRREYHGSKHHLIKSGDIIHLFLRDAWIQAPAERSLFSSAFTDCINRRHDPVKTLPVKRDSFSLHCMAPQLSPSQDLVLTGSIPSLGCWDVSKSPRMSDGNFPEWNVMIEGFEPCEGFEFKFVLVDKDSGEIIAWESGSNRHMSIKEMVNGNCISKDCGEVLFDIHKWYGAGTAIPVFSVRTEEDFGVGDFHSLRKMIDWCVETGQKILQVLPINDTTMCDTWRDSYPYNANSTFALHPMYLHLPSVGSLNEPARIEHYNRIAKELNALPVVDYERVTRTKDLYARELYAQVADTLDSDTEFTTFVSHNSYWLTPYAAYRFLRDRFKTSDMRMWNEYSTYDAVKIAKLTQNNAREIRYHYFVQYHLDKQMRATLDYASQRGVAIKGDIPIGIARTSVDAWLNPRLFNLDCQAGAPPDAFSTLGQNWGFPTYNWDEMSRDRYEWWKSRFRKMSEYFNAYRIDHVLGFFRIWEIPENAIHGLLGYFNPALPLKPDDMSIDYDFIFDRELYTTPYIVDNMLPVYFGQYADEVRSTYLRRIPGTHQYSLFPEVDNQRKIAALFASKEHDERNHRICEGLLSLIDEVLFIEDPYHKGTYHPRISAQSTFVYRDLPPHDQWRFDRLYHDFFYRRHNSFWADKAMSKLPPLIDATSMLVCAEDLGMIPDCVPDVMAKLQILSLEIQRMPKEYGVAFGDTQHYPYLSVCSTSTHDMSGIRKWWEEDPDLSERFFHEILHCDGKAPKTAEPWICDRIIDTNLNAASMLCIFPLQDWLSVNGTIRRDNPDEERINEPSNPLQYWQYRMHITVEQLLENKEFTTCLREKIKKFGR